MILKDLLDVKASIVFLHLTLRDIDTLVRKRELLIGIDSFLKVDRIMGFRNAYHKQELGYFEIPINMHGARDYYKIIFNNIPVELLDAQVFDFHIYEHLKGIDASVDLLLSPLVIESIFSQSHYLT